MNTNHRNNKQNLNPSIEAMVTPTNNLFLHFGKGYFYMTLTGERYTSGGDKNRAKKKNGYTLPDESEWNWAKREFTNKPVPLAEITVKFGKNIVDGNTLVERAVKLASKLTRNDRHDIGKWDQEKMRQMFDGTPLEITDGAGIILSTKINLDTTGHDVEKATTSLGDVMPEKLKRMAASSEK